MELSSQINQYYVRPDKHLKMTYQQLVSSQLDLGFISVLKDGKDYHQITRDIVLSVQRFHNGQITNLLFSDGQPIRLELDDTELIPYYSDYIEIRYIISGSLKIKIEENVFVFSENQIVFIDSMAYRQESLDPSDCIFVNINVRREVFNDAFLNNIGLSPLQQFLRSNIMKLRKKQHYLTFTPASGKSSATTLTCISTIFQEVKNHRPGYLEISRGYIIRLMDDLAANYQYDLKLQGNEQYTQKLFESITEFMNTNLSSVTLQSLEEEFHFHPNYFNNLIRKMTSLSYSDYLIHLRIARTKELLASSDLAIDEIMVLIGYNNKGFFYRKFKELTGMTPAKYRDKLSHAEL